jgi:hypothetical protein
MKNPKPVHFLNEKLNFSFFYDKITGFFLKLGLRVGLTFKFAGKGDHGQRVDQCHSPLTSTLSLTRTFYISTGESFVWFMFHAQLMNK